MKILPSHRSYDEMNDCAQTIACLTNPQLFPFNPEFQMGDTERMARLCEEKDRMAELMWRIERDLD